MSVDVATLQLHLRDDAYRSFNHLDAEGRNTFEVTRWKIERLQRQRPADPAEWEVEDHVLEFARARVLERLHRFGEAAEAYRRVAGSHTDLAPVATSAARTMLRFAALGEPLAGAPGEDPETGLARIEARIAAWTELAAHEPDAGYRSLAREAAESWEMLRVAFLARERGPSAGIDACEQLIERHRTSKLYPRHLLQLGDLHTSAARDIVIWSRAQEQRLRDTDYQQHFESALSSYELASEARTAVFRREAQSRMQSLLAYHDGVVDGVY